jgi:predicted anti-sigma-YlaC factor YlaD
MSTGARGDLNCPEVIGLATEYLEGTLAEPESARVDRHLARCPPCATWYAQLREVSRLLRQLAHEEAPVPERTRGRLLAAFRAWKRSLPSA